MYANFCGGYGTLVWMQINGCRQRFLTKFLQVRLVEVQDIVEKRVKSLEAEAIELEVRHDTGRANLFSYSSSSFILGRIGKSKT